MSAKQNNNNPASDGKSTEGKAHKAASLKDIATHLGISAATASRALQGNPAISEATRRRVEMAARELGYTKNFIADGLRSGSLPVIGVIVPHAVTLFYSSVLDGIEQAAAEAGYAVISMNSHESFAEERHCVESLSRLHVAGIIASATQQTENSVHFHEQVRRGCPVVFVAREAPDSQCSSVVADGSDAAYRATRHLYDQGCRRIAVLCGPGRLKMVADRKHGYIEALHDCRLPVVPSLVAYSDINRQCAVKAVEALIDQTERPDAILALNDTLLFAAMEAVKKRGLRVPDDIALIGFSDVEYAEFTSPTLSTIEDQSLQMGIEACRLLLDHIKGNATPRRIVVPTVQMIRQSSQRTAE